jgi:hypothetical protein
VSGSSRGARVLIFPSRAFLDTMVREREKRGFFLVVRFLIPVTTMVGSCFVGSSIGVGNNKGPHVTPI